ncbi:MAG: LysM peptidoglycan-binding domain-containing protein [Chloroflexi bacterium]|nr:LysM peptidoglycan-binding domain-containing protein [Chloroflexota bacterium]
MLKLRNRWLWLVGSVFVLLFTAGCYQQSGVDPEPLSPIEVGEALQPTNTLPPTLTPEPILPTEALPELLPTEAPVEPLPTEAPVDLATPAPFFPTDDPFAAVPTTDLLFPPLPTDDLFGQSGSPEVAQLPTIDPAESLFQEEQPLQEEIDPVFLTATAIIANATATEAYYLTATAIGSGFCFPTETPTPTPTTPGVVTLPGNDCVHTVQAGENLFRISLRYNVDVYQLATYNQLSNMNLIVVGQQITIPGCGTGGTTPPTDGGTPGTGLCSSPYIVQQGDTLFKISLRCGVPVMSIAAANGISNINLILINQQLVIPPG